MTNNNNQFGKYRQQTDRKVRESPVNTALNDNSLKSDSSKDEINEISQNNNIRANEYLSFMKENPKTGALKIQTNTAQQTIPVTNALIEVSKNFNGIRRVFYSLRTDNSGIVDDILLPAPDKSLSQQPSNKKPFSNYDIHVEHPGFNSKDYSGVLIFDGIKSIQQIDLIPLS